MASQKRHVLIDTDAGLDDAWALFMMLAAHNNPKSDVNVVGITCVMGNTGVHNVTKNVTRLLQTAKESKIPVYLGAEHEIAVSFHRQDPPFHGSDGFGDAGLPEIEPKLEKEDAVSLIIRLANEYETGTLSVLALGPLTNFAIALRAKPTIKDKFKEIVILGGNIHATGNITVCGEFNFVQDPEAARIVLENFTCPLKIIPLETFHLAYIPRFFEFRLNVLKPMTTSEIQLLNAIEEKNLARLGYWAAADAVAAAVFIEPKIVTKEIKHYCTVELHGNFTRGMMVVDKRNLFFPNQQPNATIVTEFDLDLYQKIVHGGVGGPFYK